MTGGGGDEGEGNSWLIALIELALRVQLITLHIIDNTVSKLFWDNTFIYLYTKK